MTDDANLRGKLEQAGAQAGTPLTEAQIDQLSSYLSALKHWNRTINLTALPLAAFPEATVARLVTEPLQASLLVTVSRGTWYDLGSGSGSPAIPMATQLRALELTMVESRGRKAAFLREAARVVGLSAARVISDRIGSLVEREPAGAASLVSLRAVRIDGEVSTAIDHLVSAGGELLLIGSTDWSLLESRFEVLRTIGSAVLLVRRRST